MSDVDSNFKDLKNPGGKVEEDEGYGKSNIPADGQRHHNSQEKFVDVLYNDILQILQTKWRKIDSSKSSPVKEFREKISGEIDSNPNEKEKNENENEKGFEKKDKGFGLGLSDWRLSSSDEQEYVEIEFENKNIYAGPLSHRQMEGRGTYRWRSGETYKGEFEENSIQGKGRIEWKDQSWYEGEFHKGYRHGKGNLVSHEYGRFYTGEWYMGRKHGNGYCRYGKADDSYDGEWNMDQKDGNGYRIYENATSYIGQLENGQRHGIGTMIWPNGDLYRGEWEAGMMDGYGEYVWKGFFNRSLSWPRENSYMGEWKDGMRHGRGVLKLNSVGGAKYSGNWYNDKKHGHGMIIGNSGAVTKADPLFLNNILTPLGTDPNYSQTRDSAAESTAANSEKEFGKHENLSPSTAWEVPIQREEARKTTVFEPLQFPSLCFHVQRLLEPFKYPQKPSTDTIIQSGKCRVCASQSSSCTCLYDPLGGNVEGRSTEKSEPIESSFDISFSNNSNDQFCTNEEDSAAKIKEKLNLELTEDQYEEHWVHNCLTIHMSELRKIYKLYAELYCSKEDKIHPNLSMGKIALWQLMRDCGIHEKGISLIQFERYMALNKSAFIESEFYPFERIEFFQFIHALLEVSWHLYTKLNDIETEKMRGKLAGGFHRLLVNDILPNAGNLIGNVSTTYRDLLPIYSVYQLYCEVGEPHSAKDFLRATCILKGSRDPEASPSLRVGTKLNPSCLINGINAITVGERLSYIPKSNEKLLESNIPEEWRTNEDDLAHELLALRHLGAPKMISVMATICPSIKDRETDTIINMDYELTFLEFYEILLEATKTLIHEKKLSAQKEEEDEKKKEKEVEELETLNKIASKKSLTRINSVKSLITQSKRTSLNISKNKTKNSLQI